VNAEQATKTWKPSLLDGGYPEVIDADSSRMREIPPVPCAQR
jgi:hypothetical protein